MFAAGEPIDVEAQLANPKTYEDTILRIFTKRSERGAGFSEAHNGVSYFSTSACPLSAHTSSSIALWQSRQQASYSPTWPRNRATATFPE